MNKTHVTQGLKSVHRATSCTRAATFSACAIALCLGSVAPSHAKDFCVSSGQALQNALLEAAENGVDDTIKLRSGTGYFPTIQSGFVANISDGKSISIEGGYADANCPTQTAGAETTWITGDDGSGANPRRLMSIFFSSTLAGATPSSFMLNNVTLRNGKGTTDTAPVFRVIGTAWRGDVIIENVSVRDNEMDRMAVQLSTRGDIVVRNSQFVRNEGMTPDAWVLDLRSDGVVGDKAVYFINNTVAANTTTDGSNQYAVTINATNSASFHNSIVRSANSRSVFFSGGHLEIANSSMDSHYLANMAATVAEHHQHNTHPVFVSENDFHLVAPTPLINGGNLDAAGLGVGDTDISGKPRKVGPVDVGAYECQDCLFLQVPGIFSSGFEN